MNDENWKFPYRTWEIKLTEKEVRPRGEGGKGLKKSIKEGHGGLLIPLGVAAVLFPANVEG